MPSKLVLVRNKIAAFAGGLGATGLFTISFLDSSVLSFPILNDLLLIDLSIKHPARMPLYALSATVGSVAGCVLLYFLARKGGEALFHQKAGGRAGVIRHWVEQNGFFGVLIAALLPPPTPFKVFVFAAGVFEVPLLRFILAVLSARLFRYFGIGYLSIRYGADALPYLAHHKLHVTVLVIGLVTVSYMLSQIVLKKRHPETPPAAKSDQV
ncbi:MAG: VTT domain-containing protein [Acidobacteriia bacterium]|nr:VTT domain-containing protein [Terriglobia bacterium]